MDGSQEYLCDSDASIMVISTINVNCHIDVQEKKCDRSGAVSSKLEQTV